MVDKDNFNVDYDFDALPTDGPDFQVKTRRKKKAKRAFSSLFLLIYIISVLALSLFLAGIALSAANDFFALVKDDAEYQVDIPENATVPEVAKLLDDTGVINSAKLFEFIAPKIIKDNQLYPGRYVLNSKMDYRTIIYTLEKLKSYRETVTVTIPEGYTISQISALLNEKLVCEEDDFLNAIKNADYDYDYLQGLERNEHRFEGFLFPDTYEFYINDDPKNVIKKMLSNFNKKIEPILESINQNEYSINDIVTIASMIEREAKFNNERTRISGVIYNRLHSKDFPYLQVDATLQYALGHKGVLTDEDLQMDNPYNTYLYKGLPPTPIANPGIECIVAALNPEEHNFYYYAAKPDGTHIFSKTLEEHNRARAEIATMSDTDDEDEA